MCWPLLSVWERRERERQWWKRRRAAYLHPFSLLSFFYFQTLFISCASFLFAADKQHQQMHEHGWADANLPSPPEKYLVQTSQKHTQSQRVDHQILLNSFMLMWENADFAFLLNQVLLAMFKPMSDVRFSEDSVDVAKPHILCLFDSGTKQSNV